MSHHPERQEKNCLNCGTVVQGRYCHICGQENIVSHQSFWSLTKHFVYDIFHFDGKFWDTLRHLFLKPGFVPRAYIQGRRASYLDPIRMYLFTSTIFFLLFFAFGKPKPLVDLNESRYLTRSQRLDLAMNIAAQSRNSGYDTLQQKQLSLLLDSTKMIELAAFRQSDSATPVPYNGSLYYLQGNAVEEPAIHVVSSGRTWLEQRIERSVNKFKHKYRDNINEGIAEVVDSFQHRMPYLLYLSLPFFALILKLLYRKQKQFYYSDHAVFTLYQYIFTFLLLYIIFGFVALNNWTGWGIFETLNTLIYFSWFVYLYIALKRFYGQGWGKTLGKFLLLNLMAFFVMLVLFLIFALFSLLQI